MAILTASDLRESWIQGLSDDDEDEKLTKLLTRVEVRVARYLGYPPATAGAKPTTESAEYTRYYGTVDLDRGNRLLRLDVLPVTAVDSLYDDEDHEWEEGDLVAADDYSLLDGEKGYVLLAATSSHGAFSDGDGNIKATFTAGWDSAPDDLVQAVGMLAREWWIRRSTQGWDTVPQGGGSSTPRRPDADIPEEIKTLLDPLRLPMVLL